MSVPLYCVQSSERRVANPLNKLRLSCHSYSQLIKVPVCLRSYLDKGESVNATVTIYGSSSPDDLRVAVGAPRLSVSSSDLSSEIMVLSVAETETSVPTPTNKVSLSCHSLCSQQFVGRSRWQAAWWPPQKSTCLPLLLRLQVVARFNH